MRYLVMIMAALSLIACATHRNLSTHVAKRSTHTTVNDGAPRHPKALRYSKVHPKLEAMSKYGNPDSYRVDGHTYEVMPNVNGYKKRGIASWYGTKFHKRRTSSGEKYNMYAMTAAHRTLPIPSYIRVKNLNNGRVAIIRVNDRGPFHSSRIVDLSYAAANYLGLLPKGTAPVEIASVTPRHVKSMPIAKYYIQAGAYVSKAIAQAQYQKLLRLNRTPIHLQTHHNKYFIVMGPFDNKQIMLAQKRQLNKQGLSQVISFLK